MPSPRRWPAASRASGRSRPSSKAEGIIEEAEESSCFSPVVAEKYPGLVNLMATAMWKQAGKAALGSIKQRQYLGVPPYSLSDQLRRDMAYFESFLVRCPKREGQINAPQQPPTLVSSDA